MLFERIYCLKRAVAIADLADFLTKVNWRLCIAFRLDGHDDTLFLNDSNGIAGLQEYAVLARWIDGAWYQVESIKGGWIPNDGAPRNSIAAAISGGYDSQGTSQTLHFHEFDQPCALCQAR